MKASMYNSAHPTNRWMSHFSVCFHTMTCPSLGINQGKAVLFDYASTEANNMRIMLHEAYLAFGDDKNKSAAMGFAELLGALIKDPFHKVNRKLAESLLDKMKPGVGEAYLMDQAIPWKDTERVDLRTIIKLVLSRCRIDR